MAVKVIREVVADVVKRGATRAVYAKQHDRNSRFLNVRIQEDGRDIKVDSTAAVVLNVERPDKAENMFFGTVNADGTVQVPLHPWMLTLEGTLLCDISIISQDTDVAKLTTMQFNIYVEAAVVEDGEISEEDEEYSIVVELIAKAGAMSAELNDARTGYDGTVYESVGDAIRGQAQKVKPKSVTPEALDREYVRLEEARVLGTSFYNFLVSHLEEAQEPDKKMFLLSSDNSGVFETIGSGRCVGFYASSNKFNVQNLLTGKQYLVSFNEQEITSVDEINPTTLLPNSIVPELLDRLYVEYLGIPSIRSFAELDGYITSADDLENYKTLYRFGFDSSFPKYGLLGDSVYLGYIADYFENETPKLILINSETFEKWSYVRNSAEVIKIESDDALSQDFIYAGSFHRVSDMMNYNFEKAKTYRLYFAPASGEELETNNYFAEIVYNLTSDEDELLLVPLKPNGKTFFVNLSTGVCDVSYTADQTYEPESENAQSGKAVAEALETRWERIEITVQNYTDLDEVFRRWSDEACIHIINLRPSFDGPLDLDCPESISYGKLIAYVDGSADDKLFMMSLKSGEWWQYTYQSNKIKRVNTPVIDLGTVGIFDELKYHTYRVEDNQHYIIYGVNHLDAIGAFVCVCCKGSNYWYLQGISLDNGRAYRVDMLNEEIVDTTKLKTVNRIPLSGEGNLSFIGKNILYAGLKGKAVSFLGDSITTFEGWIPSDYGVYYTKEKQEASGITDVERTWWRQVLNATGMKLCVNASWTGSSVSSSRTTNSEGLSNDNTYAKMGCSTKRIADLTAGGGRPSEVADGTKPDIIVVMIGINDFGDNVPVGNWAGEALPSEGSFNTFSEPYALMVSKIMTAYPNAELFLCTLPETPGRSNWDDTAGFPVNQNTGVTLKEYNDRIRLIAEVFGCNLIDMHACGINYFNGSKYLYDQLHPNNSGANLLARRAIADITARSIYNYEPVVSNCNIPVLKDVNVGYNSDELTTECLLYSSSEEFEQGECGLPTGNGYDQWRVLTCDIPTGAKSISVHGAAVYNGTGARFNLIAPVALYDNAGKLLSIYDVAAIDYHQVSYVVDVLEFPIPDNATVAKISWRLGNLARLDTNETIVSTETSPIITWQVDDTYDGTLKKDNMPEEIEGQTWYVDVAKYSTMSATAKASSASYSYCHPDAVSACTGVPINALRLAVATAGVMTYGKVSDTAYTILGTLNLTNPSTSLQIYRINEVVLNEGERLWFSKSSDTGNIYYGSNERRTPKARFNTKVSSDNLAPASYSVANLSIDIGYIES